MEEASSWIAEETQTVELRDARLKKRLSHLLADMSQAPSYSIPGACKSWKETLAAYRFFNHRQVTESKILKPHQMATLARIKQEKIVLIPQDTTEIEFSKRAPIEGMGYLGQEKSQGFYLHPSLAITPERLCLGVVHIQSWIREKLGNRALRNKRAIEEKESYCWVKGYEAANAVALEAKNTIIVSIADRGGDLYELLEKSPSESNKAYWLTRSGRERKILSADGESEQCLWESVRKLKPMGEMEFQLPGGRVYHRKKEKRFPRQSRVVRQELRSCAVEITVPRRKSREHKSVSVYVVHCREIKPPHDKERVEWLLLTSYPVEQSETAIEIVNWYLCRWQIETFFKILKSGCRVEKLQFETLRATQNCMALYLIIAWRILYLTLLGRHCPEMDCNQVFEEEEWQSVYMIVTRKQPPPKPPPLNAMIKMIAMLGGFLGRKNDGEPGPQVMWIGIQRMRDFTLAWEVFRSQKEKTYV